MSHLSRAFAPLSLALALIACGDDGGDGTAASTDPATDASTDPATDPPAGTTTSTADPGTTDDTPTTTGTATPDETSSGTTAGESTAGETDDPDTDTAVDACEASLLTWENFGEPFMLSWCTGCHHSALPTAERAGAPCAANFDTHAGASERAGIILLRTLEWQNNMNIAPMPPAAIIPEDELSLLREWLECGAPGPETGMSGPACPDP